jgi:flagellar basal body-associated protein FliL
MGRVVEETVDKKKLTYIDIVVVIVVVVIVIVVVAVYAAVLAR